MAKQPRTVPGWECDHLRQVARNLETNEWHHVDSGMITGVCTSGPYEVLITIEGEHVLSKLYMDPE